MTHSTLAFLGGGNMARALVDGLLRHGWTASDIRVADPDPAAREYFGSRHPGLVVAEDNQAVVDGAATWVLAVKPQQAREVLTALHHLAEATRPLVISIAAGIRAGDLATWLGGTCPVVRCMPNRPALVGSGITALYARPDVDVSLRARATAVLESVGACVWLEDEALLDAVTAVSGSGPAYVFLLIEMLEAAAQAEGIDPRTARQLAVETLFGAARMAREGNEDPAVMRARVTSKGGTTAAALEVLERAGIRGTFVAAIHAATLRSRELARESGG